MKTLREIKNYMHTLPYCEEKCMAENYDLTRCKAELKRLAENERINAEDAWLMLLEATGGNETEAEREMVMMLYLPPTFRSEIRCVICGPVLVKDSTLPCPWCDTDLPVLIHEELSLFKENR